MFFPCGELGKIGLYGGMRPHLLVHGRGDDDAGSGGEIQCGEEIVGNAVCQFGQCIGAGWGDEVNIGPARQLDMAHALFGMRIKKRAAYCFATDGLQSER